MTDPAEFQQAVVKHHTELSQLLAYPPFTVEWAFYREFRDSIQRDHARLAEIDAPEQVYLRTRTTYADEIEEARLWRARYGDDTHSARRHALELVDDPDDPRYEWFTF
ncbi:hypothetical protein [Rhabdothermincola salaria]|uniref:hypothetical protein n=1 Tax=Rhabdothermincola salaria TaxID=2903142 RepID=UPI001E650535|nr:hypothetical protein [Rhabdothermincola salaria]MCD9625290.1 hypothetical protein [Rhabdothermincola salaria]